MQEFSNLILEPSLIAMVSWWFGTGIILLLVRIPKQWFAVARGFWSLISIPALFCCHQSMQENSNANAYLGFISTIVLWGWHELTFLTGWISGSRKQSLEPHLNTWNRFKQSVQVVWHHELALFVNLMILLGMQIGHPNHTAICTFALLWLMRLSSKLNLFFGVPQVGEQYLPSQLAYMGSYFRKSEVGLFFYFTMSLSVLTWVGLVWQAHEGQVAITSHWVLLASLLGLAIVEHVLMMIPLSLERVWGWALKSDSNPVETNTSGNVGCVFDEALIIPIANPSLLSGQTIDTKTAA
jgi:putative photosynthetic complex assembly protein 2